MVKIGRVLIVEGVDQTLQLLLLLGGALEQEGHMLDTETVWNQTSVVRGIRLGTRVAPKRNQLRVIDGLRDAVGNTRCRCGARRGCEEKTGWDQHADQDYKQSSLATVQVGPPKRWFVGQILCESNPFRRVRKSPFHIQGALLARAGFNARSLGSQDTVSYTHLCQP